MHCDTLTVCADRGLNLSDCGLQTDLSALRQSGCAAQCFAVFTQDKPLSEFERYVDFFKRSGAFAICGAGDLLRCLKGDICGAILTAENLGFIGEDLSLLYRIKDSGVKMASLVWNKENSLAYPNLVFKNGLPDFAKREKRGLKPLGRQAAEILDGMGVIIDISHLSDGGAEELLDNRKIPLAASHSGAQGVCNVSRNLSDALIRKIADCGGVVGVNFCKDFLGGGDTFGAVYAHIKYLIDVGGEDVIAFGSDFDGIPPCDKLESCLKMPALLRYLSDKLPARTVEKLCYENFLRVFKEVCG